MGFIQLAVPIFTKEQAVGEVAADARTHARVSLRMLTHAHTRAQATQSFVTNRALMTRLADATERLMGSYKEVNSHARTHARTQSLTHARTHSQIHARTNTRTDACARR